MRAAATRVDARRVAAMFIRRTVFTRRFAVAMFHVATNMLCADGTPARERGVRTPPAAAKMFHSHAAAA
jgi:hypothetical protein